MVGQKRKLSSAGRKRHLSVEDREAQLQRFHSAEAVDKLVKLRCDDRCHHGCLFKFAKPELRLKLREFRKDWSELHKLDQDNVAALT